MGPYICRTCGTIGQAKTVTKGNILIEVILWLCFLIPGLIYSVWRLTTRSNNGCYKCGALEMIPVNTPIGQSLFKELHGNKTDFVFSELDTRTEEVMAGFRKRQRNSIIILAIIIMACVILANTAK